MPVNGFILQKHVLNMQKPGKHGEKRKLNGWL